MTQQAATADEGAAPVIRCEQVVRTYTMGGAPVPAVRGVDLTIARGDFVAITGASGCGKSTLLHLLGAVEPPDAGRVWVDGRDTSAMGDREATAFRLRHVGFVFQRFYLLPTLSGAVLGGGGGGGGGGGRGGPGARARELLGYVGLAGRADHRPPQLSGGEQQRVAIARALANAPRVLLADEPTGELDAETGAQLLALFGRLHRDGTTLVFVTHDAAVAQAAARVVRLQDGRIASDTRREAVGAP
jgi:putative ABC transport system ATP-binding protein